MDDPNLEEHNVDSRIEEFVEAGRKLSNVTYGNANMLTMGCADLSRGGLSCCRQLRAVNWLSMQIGTSRGGCKASQVGSRHVTLSPVSLGTHTIRLHC